MEDDAPPAESLAPPPMEALLAAATMRPALPTVIWCPRPLKARVGDVLAQLLHESTTMLETASCSAECTQALQLLWIAPSLLLRRPPTQEGKAAAVDGREGGDLSLVATIRHRIARAEQGDWTELLVEYLSERTAAEAKGRRGPAEDLESGDVAARLEVLAAAVRKVEGGCLRAATQLLRGDSRIPGTAETTGQLEALTALPVDDQERAALREQLEAAYACVSEVPPIKVRTLRRKLRTIKRGAEPGPSGWRNATLVLVGERPQGCEVLTRWCRQYARGAMYPWDAKLWASVCLVPLDKGEGKIRPIALGEVLPKLAQATLLDTLEKQLRQSFEPRQLSVRSPGGAEVLARTLRAWTARPDGRVLLQLDLKNAYGRMLRSRTLRAVVRRCPALAPQLAQQWSPGVTWAWARTNGVWGTFLSERGGWQGSPDSNPTFCYGLEDALDDGLADAVGILRLGYADDTFLDGPPVALDNQWPRLRVALEEAGHEVQPNKCIFGLGALSIGAKRTMQHLPACNELSPPPTEP